MEIDRDKLGRLLSKTLDNGDVCWSSSEIQDAHAMLKELSHLWFRVDLTKNTSNG